MSSASLTDDGGHSSHRYMVSSAAVWHALVWQVGPLQVAHNLWRLLSSGGAGDFGLLRRK